MPRQGGKERSQDRKRRRTSTRRHREKRIACKVYHLPRGEEKIGREKERDREERDCWIRVSIEGERKGGRGGREIANETTDWVKVSIVWQTCVPNSLRLNPNHISHKTNHNRDPTDRIIWVMCLDERPYFSPFLGGINY